MILCRTVDFCRQLLAIAIGLFRSRAAVVDAETSVLRQQIFVLRRGRPSRVPIRVVGSMVLRWACQLFPKICEALSMVLAMIIARFAGAVVPIALVKSK